MKKLCQYEWPGNVRELQNVIERALLLSRGPILEIPDILENRQSSDQTLITGRGEKQLNLDLVIKNHIQYVLSQANGRIKGENGAAQLLGMNPSTLRFRIKKLGIKI